MWIECGGSGTGCANVAACAVNPGNLLGWKIKLYTIFFISHFALKVLDKFLAIVVYFYCCTAIHVRVFIIFFV